MVLIVMDEDMCRFEGLRSVSKIGRSPVTPPPRPHLAVMFGWILDKIWEQSQTVIFKPNKSSSFDYDR